MNWEEYLDPWLRDRVNRYTREDVPSDPVIRAPQYSDYPQDNLRSGTWWEAAKDFVTDIYPGRSTMDYLATGQPSTGIVGDLAGDLAGPIGKLGAAAKGLPALAGMVEWSGKKYPQAFLHRSIDPREVTYFRALAGKGIESEKPMTLVAPNSPTIYRPEERKVGFLFNARDDDIRKWWKVNVGSVPTQKDIHGTILKKEEWAPRGDLPETWLEEREMNRGDDLFALWDYIRNYTETYPYKFYFNEAFAKYGKDNLAGVRIAPSATQEEANRMLGLAEDFKVPVYSWDPSNEWEKLQLSNLDKLVDSTRNSKALGKWVDDVVALSGNNYRLVKRPEAGVERMTRDDINAYRNYKVTR